MTVQQFHCVFERRMDRLERMLGKLLKGEKDMAADLTALTAAVDAETTVDDSILALVTGLVAQIKAAGTDQAALDALTAKLTGEAQRLSDAVTANTPAAP